MEKKVLRNKIITSLKTLTKSKRIKIENKLYSNLFKSQLWTRSTTIGITCSLSFEWNTLPIIKKAWEENKRVAVPKSDPKANQLTFYYITSLDQVNTGYSNILEPIRGTVLAEKNEIDLLLVPGVVFDLSGYRIGFGGGFYDRYLHDYPNKTVSLASHIQIVKNIPSESHDIPVQYIVHEQGCINVNKY